MESHLKIRNAQRKRRALRVRKKLRGTASKPRLTVFRSNKHLQVQLIDDENQLTLFGIGTASKQFKGTDFAKKSMASAREIGKLLAAEAKMKNIESLIFDRGFYKYHGLVAELANAAREEGLRF